MLAKQTVKVLRAIAKSLGVKGFTRLPKDKLITAILAVCTNKKNCRLVLKALEQTGYSSLSTEAMRQLLTAQEGDLRPVFIRKKSDPQGEQQSEQTGPKPDAEKFFTKGELRGLRKQMRANRQHYGAPNVSTYKGFRSLDYRRRSDGVIFTTFFDPQLAKQQEGRGGRVLQRA